MRNILMLIDGLDVTNGVSQTCREIFENWNAANNWKLYILGSGTTTPEQINSEWASFIICNSFFRIPLVFYPGVSISFPFKKLSKLLHDYKFDVIHAMTPGPLGFAGFYFSKKLKIPFVTTHHTRMKEYANFYIPKLLQYPAYDILDITIRTMYRQSIITIAHSPDAVKEAVLFGASQVKYIPMGINIPFRNVEHLIAKRHEARRLLVQQLGFHEEKPILLYVGRLGKEKNLSIILSAITSLKYPLIIAGDGPLRDEIRRHPCIKHFGFVYGNQLSNLYLAADLLVNASTSETLGRTFLEALAHGTPIMVPDFGYHNSVFHLSPRVINKFKWLGDDAPANEISKSLEKAIEKYFSIENNPKNICKYALDIATNYSWKTILHQHIQPYIEASK